MGRVISEAGVQTSGTALERIGEKEEDKLTEQITVDVTAVRGRVVVSAAGEIDIATAPVLRAAIDTTIQDRARQLVVDLQGGPVHGLHGS